MVPDKKPEDSASKVPEKQPAPEKRVKFEDDVEKVKSVVEKEKEDKQKVEELQKKQDDKLSQLKAEIERKEKEASDKEKAQKKAEETKSESALKEPVKVGDTAEKPVIKAVVADEWDTTAPSAVSQNKPAENPK